MIDTVKIRSPYLTEEQASAVADASFLRSCTEISTEEIQYEIISGWLEGSFDHRVSVRLLRDSFSPSSSIETRAAAPLPFLLLEGSVHKALLGHNVHGGPCEWLPALRWFVADVARRLGVFLPPADDWEAIRVDVAEVYELQSFVAVEEYMHGLNLAHYGRRKVTRYADQSLHVPGTTTGVKAYHKGPEFKAHDAKRLKPLLSRDDYGSLLQRADSLLRCEVEFKHKLLQQIYKTKAIKVKQINMKDLIELHDVEFSHLLRNSASSMETVRTHTEVSGRLHSVYNARLARILYGMWLMLAADGEEVVKARMSPRTFYHQRKQLQEAAVTWHGADIGVIEQYSHIPKGFFVGRDSPFRLTEQAAEVVAQIAEFRDAA